MSKRRRARRGTPLAKHRARERARRGRKRRLISKRAAAKKKCSLCGRRSGARSSTKMYCTKCQGVRRKRGESTAVIGLSRVRLSKGQKIMPW